MSGSTQFIDVAGANGAVRKIAYRQDADGGAGVPGVIWLGGYASDMASSKADALSVWGQTRGAGFLRFDYTGHGQSEGRFADFTIGDCVADARAAFTRLTTGPQIVVGSSMGGWVALELARALGRDAPAEASRLKALVLIAPAWDMTEELMWNHFSPEMRAALERDGAVAVPSEYGEPYTISRALIEEGRTHLLAPTGFDPGCPVRILQGMRDKDVPWGHSLRLMGLLCGADVRFTLVKDGEHRMSRDGDLALLCAAVGEFAG